MTTLPSLSENPDTLTSSNKSETRRSYNFSSEDTLRSNDTFSSAKLSPDFFKEKIPEEEPNVVINKLNKETDNQLEPSTTISLEIDQITTESFGYEIGNKEKILTGITCFIDGLGIGSAIGFGVIGMFVLWAEVHVNNFILGMFALASIIFAFFPTYVNYQSETNEENS